MKVLNTHIADEEHAHLRRQSLLREQTMTAYLRNLVRRDMKHRARSDFRRMRYFEDKRREILHRDV